MLFQDVFVRKPSRSLFNLKHEKKFSCDFGYLYPILCVEAVPGDTFKLSTEFLVRCAPLIAPIMHRINVKINYFFVPNRLVWSEWQDFITGINQSSTYDPTSSDQSNYFVTKVPPYSSISYAGGVQTYLYDGSLADFLGFPTIPKTSTSDASSANPIKVQLLPFRAYQKIYNDWYRNQNVEAEVNFGTSSGLNNSTSSLSACFTLRKRMWEKDYFTSALPFAQRGDAVDIPNSGLSFDADGMTVLKDLDGSVPPTSETGKNVIVKTTSTSQGLGTNTDSFNVDNSANLKINMGTINDLRIATRLQRWLEINARVGGRYIEQILGHFGVHSSDARLQRSEYLGGFSAPIVVSDVEQTSATAGSSSSGSTTPQANLAGKASAYSNGKSIKCFCEEHGFIFGILSIIPRTTYQNGLPKMFQRDYKEDYFFPEFANLGEQEVNKAEVFFDLTSSSNRSFDRFGFQERYCEYKYIPSTVHGEFKNNLQFWHLGRSFTGSQPSLSKDFCECNPRNTVFAVESGANHFYVNLINNVTALRPMPKQAIPTL